MSCVPISHISRFTRGLSNRPQSDLYLPCLAQGGQPTNITETHTVQC